MTFEVLALIPKGMNASFKAAIPVKTEKVHMYGGYPGQCVHSEWVRGIAEGDMPTLVRCENPAEDSLGNGFLCGGHQYASHHILLTRRRKQMDYEANRDKEQEFIDSIVLPEKRAISRSTFLRVARGLRVEKDRQLAPLASDTYDGIWEDVDFRPVMPDDDRAVA